MHYVKSKWGKIKLKPGKNNTAYSICDGLILYAERVVIPLSR